MTGRRMATILWVSPSGSGQVRRRLRSALPSPAGCRVLDYRLRQDESRQGKLGESNMKYARLAATLLLNLAPFGVLAQTATQPPPTQERSGARSPALKQARAKMRAACAADLQKFCADVERGKGARRKCLRSHRTEISPECKSARQELRVTRSKKRS
jgi:hypothetical protein